MTKAVPFSYSTYVPGVARKLPAGNRMQLPWVISSGIGDTMMTRRFHKNGPIALSNLQAILLWINFDPNNGESSVGNGATITCSIEYPVGSTPIPFKINGSTSFSVVDGQTIISDPLGVSLPANALYAVRSFVNPGSGGKVPYGALMYPTGCLSAFGSVADGSEYVASGTDKTLSGTVTSTNGNPGTIGWEPIIVGESMTWTPCVLGIGDSIMSIGGDMNPTTHVVSAGAGDAYGNAGWFSRLFGGAGIANLNIAEPSATGATWATWGYTRSRWQLLRYASSAIIALGTNDLYNGNGSIVVANLNTIIGNLRGFGIPRVYICTIPPKTTSSDGWTTVTGQTAGTVTGGETCRLNVNSSIRGTNIGAGVLSRVDGVLDLEAQVSAVQPGTGAIVWQANFTGDGVHPLPIGMNAIVSAFKPTNYL